MKRLFKYNCTCKNQNLPFFDSEINELNISHNK